MLLKSSARPRRTPRLFQRLDNPDFLDELEAKEIILCDKVNGITQVRHAADVKDVQGFKKYFRLGELWEQGTLGGIP